jgi:hypothetical protein
MASDSNAKTALEMIVAGLPEMSKYLASIPHAQQAAALAALKAHYLLTLRGSSEGRVEIAKTHYLAGISAGRVKELSVLLDGQRWWEAARGGHGARIAWRRPSAADA